MSLAMFKKGLPRGSDGKLRSPPKQNKQHKQRSQHSCKPAAMPEPCPEPVPFVATVMAVPVPFLVQNAPIVAATPLPMRLL